MKEPTEGVCPILVLSRKKNESIVIGEDIIITLMEIRGDKCRLGIQAPKEVPVHRQEVHAAICAEGIDPREQRIERMKANGGAPDAG